MNINTPRLDDGSKLRAVELSADEADSYIKGKPWPRNIYFSDGEEFVCKDNTFTNTEDIDYSLHTSDCADTSRADSTDDAPRSEMILACCFILTVAAVVSAFLVTIFVRAA